MASAAPQAVAATKALETVLRQDRGRLMAALVARLRSFQLAEDAFQDACLSALVHWGRSGLPRSPQGWLLTVAFRKALDRLRGDGRSIRREQELVRLDAIDPAEDIPDERLRLIFTCCHPALDLKSRVALTLRTVCNIPTRKIARLFLDEEATMGQRLSRAKAKIAAAGIPFAIPEPEQWDERLQAVLTTVYLIFTTGYTAGTPDRHELCGEAIFLARLLLSLRPGQPEIEGALALMLLTDARSAARIGPGGATVPPAGQDRRLWDTEKASEGRLLLETALGRRRAGPFQIKAAISACHMADRAPDWPQIVQLYTMLLILEPSPIVRLNHAVALSETGNQPAALHILDELRPTLAGFQPFHAAEAAIFAKSGNPEGARDAYRRAIDTSDNEADRLMLAGRLEWIS